MSKQDLESLQQLISGMDLPTWRKTQMTPHNLRWLSRNMGIRNANHPAYQKALAIIARLIHEEINV